MSTTTHGAAVAGVVTAALAACSSASTHDASVSDDCAVVVHWQGRTYESALYAMKTEKLDSAAVATPTAAESLGRGVEDGCNEGHLAASAGSIQLFAIAGVAPTEAVTTQQRTLLVIHGGRIPPALVHRK